MVLALLLGWRSALLRTTALASTSISAAAAAAGVRLRGGPSKREAEVPNGALLGSRFPPHARAAALVEADGWLGDGFGIVGQPYVELQLYFAPNNESELRCIVIQTA